MTDELLLPPEVIKKTADFVKVLPDLTEIEEDLETLLYTAVLEGAKAQLAKARPLIEKRERERILSIIDEWYILSEEEWEAKYGRDSTEFLDFLGQALRSEK